MRGSLIDPSARSAGHAWRLVPAIHVYRWAWGARHLRVKDQWGVAAQKPNALPCFACSLPSF
eukprot:3598270-Alexandrium_andersonii.AAC.1